MLVAVDGELRPSGTPRQLDAPLGTNRQLAWTRDGKELIFASGGTVSTRLYRTQTNGRPAARLLSSAGEVAYQPAVAPSGDRIAYVHDFNTGNIWKLPVSKQGRALTPVEITYSARTSWIWPNAFSADGSKIAFESFRTGPRGIWTADADGSNAKLIFGDRAYSSGSPAWSPDGTRLAFDTRNRGKTDLYLISTESGASKRLTYSEGDHLIPCWAHDGNWIYFTSVRNQELEVMKIPSSGGAEAQVTRNGGWGPQESLDGKDLFYTRDGSVNTPLLKVPVAGGPEEVVLPYVRARRWTVTKNGIWFMKSLNDDERDRDRWLMESAGTQEAGLYFYRFSTRTVIPSGAVVRNPASGIAAPPDGSAVFYNQVDHRAAEIVILEHFR
jgi:dipeptidyl aminopeptidase/acylaminoacyl peptidase